VPLRGAVTAPGRNSAASGWHREVQASEFPSHDRDPTFSPQGTAKRLIDEARTNAQSTCLIVGFAIQADLA
jgi:hypothetical protein